MASKPRVIIAGAGQSGRALSARLQALWEVVVVDLVVMPPQIVPGLWPDWSRYSPQYRQDELTASRGIRPFSQVRTEAANFLVWKRKIAPDASHLFLMKKVDWQCNFENPEHSIVH